MKTHDLERRILRMWKRASEDEQQEGANWYLDANAACDQIAKRQHCKLAVVAGVVAAISPGMRWERNLYWAEVLMVAKSSNSEALVKIPTYSYQNVNKALLIIGGASPLTVLGGRKVRAFYSLIMDGGNDRDVCIDGHAYAIATGWSGPIRNTGVGQKEAVPVSAPELRRVTEAYIKLARKLKVPPHVLQATTWVTKKRWSQPRLPVFSRKET